MVVCIFSVTFGGGIPMICLHTRNLKKKLALALSGLVLTTSLTLSALPAAEAFD